MEILSLNNPLRRLIKFNIGSNANIEKIYNLKNFINS